jgi:hypothetical protein
MNTFFDVVTVTCFAGLVIAFFRFTDWNTRTLLHLVLSGVLFAFANQLGNAGFFILAIALIFAGVTYAILVVKS